MVTDNRIEGRRLFTILAYCFYKEDLWEKGVLLSILFLILFVLDLWLMISWDMLRARDG